MPLCRTYLDGSLNATGQHKVKHIQKIIDKATNDKLVGVAVYVKSPKLGEWTVVSGYSNLEKKIPLQKDDVFGLASIGKYVYRNRHF